MFNKIIKAKKLINQHIINTPSGLSHALSELTGRSIFVKYENEETYLIRKLEEELYNSKSACKDKMMIFKL